MGGGTVLCPLCGINGIVRYRCGYGRLPAGKGITAASRRSAGKCRGGCSTAQVAGYLIRKAGAADTVCVGNRKLLDCSVQNKALRLRRSSRFCRIISICNNSLMVVCKMRQIRLGICYAIGCCAISNRTGGNNYSAIQGFIFKRSQFIIVHRIRCADQSYKTVGGNSSACIKAAADTNIAADVSFCAVKIEAAILVNCVSVIASLRSIIIVGVSVSCLIVLNGTAQQISSRVCIIDEDAATLFSFVIGNFAVGHVERVSLAVQENTAALRECLIVRNRTAAHFYGAGVIICFTGPQSNRATAITACILGNLRITGNLDACIAVPIAISRINRDRTTVSGCIAGNRTPGHNKFVGQIHRIFWCTKNGNRTAKSTSVTCRFIVLNVSAGHSQFSRSIITLIIVSTICTNQNCTAMGTLCMVSIKVITNCGISAKHTAVQLHLAAEIDAAALFSKTVGYGGAIIHNQLCSAINYDTAAPVICSCVS